MDSPVSDLEKNGADSPNRAQKSAEGAHEAKAERSDVRAELKKNLAEEFSKALSAQTNLTDPQRDALVDAVNDNQVTATSILQAISLPQE